VTPTPVTMAKGSNVQLTATATLSDMTTVDVTQTATWTSNNLAAVTVSHGLLHGLDFGQATVTAASEAIASPGVRVVVGDNNSPPASTADAAEQPDGGI